MARSSRRRNTPASSPVEMPTSKSGWLGNSSRASTAARSAGPSLPAQPAALQRAVKRTNSVRDGLLSLSMDIALLFSPIQKPKSARASAQPALVADPGRQPAVIKIVEQRNCKFARCVQQIPVNRGADFTVRAKIVDQSPAGRVEGGPAEVKLGRNLDHPPFAFHRGQHGAELRSRPGPEP